MFVIPLLLLTTAAQRGMSRNIGHVTMPFFEMLVKDLPQDEIETAGEYTDPLNQQDVTDFFAKMKAHDVWKTSLLDLDVIVRDDATTFVKSARVQFDRNTLNTATLAGFNCTRYCYNVSVQAILSANSWTEDRLDGKEQPIVKLRDIHNALVKAIEERFCCNMTEIAISLGMDSVTSVLQTVAGLDVWKRFVPHINSRTIQCKADKLEVTPSELEKLLRTDLATMNAYDLNQMDVHFFPAYEDLLRRKNLFETRSITTGGLISNWRSGTMAQFAVTVSQFSPRDLQILYRWQAPQIFAIENMPMSFFESGCTTVSLIDSLFTLSQTLFGYSNNLPSCNVAFLLSRSFDEVTTKFNVSSISNQNVLEIFRAYKSNWFEIYQLLQLNIAEGIWVETPTLTQIATFGGMAVNIFTPQNSIPMAIQDIRTFNTTSTLNNIMTINYNAFLTTLYNIYGYTSSNLAQAAGITQAQLSSLTIQEAHNLVINSIESRYRITDVASLLGIPEVDIHVLINLPSFEWQRVVSAAIQNAFSQSADAYSVLLSAGGVQIANTTDGFPAIQVSDSVTYHTDRIAPTELANCLNRQLSEIHAMTFSQYHQLHIGSIVPLLRNKLQYETQSMENLLTSIGQNFDNTKSSTVAEVISLLTGLTIENLQCLYGWPTTFVSTDLAITFQTANETRLCNDFLDRTMFDIVRIIAQTPSKAFICTTDPCGANTVCRDVPDSFECTCIPGYTGNPRVLNQDCVDINECTEDLDNCHQDADCFNTVGSFYCDCKDGFNGNGTYCFVAEVSFARATSALTEGGVAVVSVNLNGKIDYIAFVTIQVTGTATENTDYTLSTKNFIFNPGESTKELNITTTDDERLESTETMILTLSSVTSHVTPGKIPSMTITIIDNDVALDPGSFNPSPPSSSNINTGVVIGVVVAALVVLIVVILIVTWILYRRNTVQENREDIGNIQNAAYEGDTQPNRRLPQVPYSDSDYEEPSDYAQLDSSKRVNIDANYQSLIHENEQGSPTDYAQLDLFNRIPVDANYQSLIHENTQGTPTNNSLANQSNEEDWHITI